jgi:hypothetical protein
MTLLIMTLLIMTLLIMPLLIMTLLIMTLLREVITRIFHTLQICNKQLFEHLKPFTPSLMFASKARAYTSEETFWLSTQ